jgi:integrase
MLVEAGRPTTPAIQTERPEERGTVGARLVVRSNDLRRFVEELRNALEQQPALTRSARHRYHQTLLLYTLVMQGLLTGVRPSNQPQRLMAEMLALGGPRDSARTIVSIVDKDDQYEARARPVTLPRRLQRQLAYVTDHAQAMWRWQPDDLSIPSIEAAGHMFLDWSDDRPHPRAQVVGTQWMTRQLVLFGLPAAANFTRAYVRTWLLGDGCSEQVVDAFLGHASLGQSPTSMHGTLDFDHHLREIGSRLERMADELGLQPTSSRLSAREVGCPAN